MNNKVKIFKKAAALICTILIITVSAVPVFATDTSGDDPLTVIGNLDEFIFSVIRLIGVGFAGFGIFQIGMSISSHDAGQRVIGIAAAVGGLIMCFAKQILILIGAY